MDQVLIHKSPLDDVHQRLGAKVMEAGGRLLPASYGDSAAEYEAVRGGGAGLIDFSSRGRVEVSGTEAAQFLNGLVTNDVKALAENSWMPATFPNVQGRLVAAVRVLKLAGDRFLFDTEAATHERVLKTLERFTLAGDFRVTDLTDELAQLSVQGAHSPEVLSATLGAEAARVESFQVFKTQWNDAPLHLIRATHTAEAGFDLFVNSADAPALWEALAQAGARPVGVDALETLRVEAGIARYGVDVDETNVVLEAPLDDAVSFTKGCYIGQEIIARIHWRGHVAKKLTGLSFDGQAEVKRGDKVSNSDGKEVGRVTSVAFSPRLNRTVALALIKYDYLAPGTSVLVRSDERELAAEVTELPFVRGSWDKEGASRE